MNWNLPRWIDRRVLIGGFAVLVFLVIRAVFFSPDQSSGVPAGFQAGAECHFTQDGQPVCVKIQSSN